MYKRLVYVSQSELPPLKADGEVERIVAISRRNNSALGITGALVFTGSRFAQVLEGSPSAVDGVHKRITADKRHGDVTTVHEALACARAFPEWAMAYHGPSSYVDRHLRALFQDLSPAVFADEAERLIDLLAALHRARLAA